MKLSSSDEVRSELMWFVRGNEDLESGGRSWEENQSERQIRK